MERQRRISKRDYWLYKEYPQEEINIMEIDILGLKEKYKKENGKRFRYFVEEKEKLALLPFYSYPVKVYYLWTNKRII